MRPVRFREAGLCGHPCVVRQPAEQTRAAPGSDVAAPLAAQPGLTEAANFWSAMDTSSLAVVDAFAARYSETVFAELARARP